MRKRKLTDRVLSFFLSLIMVFTSIPLPTFAEISVPDEFIPVDESHYHLFIDQRLENGILEDMDKEKEYFDVYNEPENEEEPKELFYKSSQYEAGTEVQLLVTPNENYDTSELFVEKIVPEDEDSTLEYDYDLESGIISFTMPESNVFVSASFILPVNLLGNNDLDDENIEEDDELSECNHDYAEVVTPPTCEDSGYTTHTCNNCGDSYTDSEVSATGHDYSGVVTNPTCDSKGYTTYTCNNCGDSFLDSETESLGHDYVEEITKNATTTEEGEKTFTCENCGDVYTEIIPIIEGEKGGNTGSNDIIKNPSPFDPSITDDLDGDITVADVYIRELSTQLFYGTESTEDGNVWVAKYHDKGHRFSFRINYAISGVDIAPENSIRFTVPKSILVDRNGGRGDYYEMSIPSKAEVDAYLNGTGESIENDVSWGYFEEGDNIIIYNFRTIPAGYNGYIEMSYFTNQTTFNYVDMAESNPFTCTMTVPKESKEADPITVKINTTANITSTNKRYPTKYNAWQSSWGDEVKPENDTDYYYLVWTIESYINATQPYIFTLEDNVVGNFEGMEVVGYRFSGQSKFGNVNIIENQKIYETRYDYVITSIPLEIYQPETYWEANNTIVAMVDPIDQLDDDTQATARRQWTWSKPVFKIPSGHFNAYKRADRSYGMGVHRASSLDFERSEYTRYDLETFNGYNESGITNTSLSGFKYASWMVGYPYPWTYDSSYNNPLNPAAYGKIPVTYELVDEGVYITKDNTTASDDVLLDYNDFEFVTLGYSWHMTDAVFNEEEQLFEETAVSYTDTDILVFYGKFNDSTEWVQFASYNIYTDEAIFDETYVNFMTSNNIVFQKDMNLVGYKITTSNAHYFTEVFTVPRLVLKNSEKVMDYVTDKPAIGIINNNYANFYDNNGSLILNVEEYATEYARASQKYSNLNKEIISVSNNPKKKTFSITWKVKQEELMESGSDGKMSYISQNGGTFYDLLPEGAILNLKSVDVQVGYSQFLSSSSYTINTIDNYKNTGRTMLIVKIKVPAQYYSVYYDTIHPWNSIKDYGNDVYNPVAYETGNETITRGFPDNGGQYFANGTFNSNAIKDARLMAGLNPDVADSGVMKFIYAQKYYDIVAITAASSGLMKKVKAENDSNYSYETTTTINGNYSYQLRYMNSYTSASKNMIFFDSLENYDYDTMRNYGTLSDWRGKLQSIDVNQLESKGINPVVYYSTISKLDIEENYDIVDASIWNVLTDETDLSVVKAIAIDMRKTVNGEDFVLGPGESVVVTLHMKAPAECPEKEGDYAYAYNNIYIYDTVFDPENPTSEQDFLIHQDYTTIKLLVTGSFGINKVSAESEETKIEGIEFRLMGTSSYGSEVNEILVTDPNGQIYFEDIEMGSYILQEYKSTDDWLLDTTEYRVVIDNTGKVWIDDVEYTDSYITITNNPRIHGNLDFFKKELGDDTIGVADTTFRLSGVSDYGNDILIFSTSEVGGKVTFENIELGTYELVEVFSNKNYALNNIVYTVEVNETGIPSIVSSNEKNGEGNDVPLEESEWFKKNENGIDFIYNAYRFFEVELRKVDVDNPTIFLEGAIFSLTGVSIYGTKFDMTASSDKNGYIAFNGVEEGTYLLKEIQAPQNVDENGNSGGTLNYLLDDTKYIVEIDHKGSVNIVGLEKEDPTGYHIVTNSRAYDKEIVITKVWKDGLTNEERIEQGLIPKLHLTNRDLTVDENFHTHAWDEGVVLSTSTCTKNGETLFTCIDCGMTNIQKQAKLEHIWDDGTIIEHTTCYKEGSMIYVCGSCQTTRTDLIAKSEHIWDAGVVTIEAGCNTTGVKAYTCTVTECGATKTETITKLGHNHNTSGVCTRCGNIVAVMTGAGDVTITVSNSDYDDNSSYRPYYSKLIMFRPTESGTYSFTIGTSTPTTGRCARLYNSNMTSRLTYNGTSSSTSTFSLSYNCMAGTTYYLAVGRYTTSSTATSIPVTITKTS